MYSATAHAIKKERILLPLEILKTWIWLDRDEDLASIHMKTFLYFYIYCSVHHYNCSKIITKHDDTCGLSFISGVVVIHSLQVSNSWWCASRKLEICREWMTTTSEIKYSPQVSSRWLLFWNNNPLNYETNWLVTLEEIW